MSLLDVLQLPWFSPQAALLLLYPTAMFFVIMATGNHFLLDAVGGWCVASLAIFIQLRYLQQGFSWYSLTSLILTISNGRRNFNEWFNLRRHRGDQHKGDHKGYPDV